MKNRVILFGTVIAVLLMLVTPCISAVKSNTVKEEVNDLLTSNDGKMSWKERLMLIFLGIGCVINSVQMLNQGYGILTSFSMGCSGLYLIFIGILGIGLVDPPEDLNDVIDSLPKAI